MESASAYFAAHPAAFTLLAIFLVVMILYFIFSKLIKLTIIVLFVILLVIGVQLFQDPASMPDKIKKTITTFKTGSQQIKDKAGNIWSDTKQIADKAKEIPKDVNKMLDTAKEDVGK